MDLSAYISWIEANFTTDEARAFMLGLGLGVLHMVIRWGVAMLRAGGKTLN